MAERTSWNVVCSLVLWPVNSHGLAVWGPLISPIKTQAPVNLPQLILKSKTLRISQSTAQRYIKTFLSWKLQFSRSNLTNFMKANKVRRWGSFLVTLQAFVYSKRVKNVTSFLKESFLNSILFMSFEMLNLNILPEDDHKNGFCDNWGWIFGLDQEKSREKNLTVFLLHHHFWRCGIHSLYGSVAWRWSCFWHNGVRESRLEIAF